MNRWNQFIGDSGSVESLDDVGKTSSSPENTVLPCGDIVNEPLKGKWARNKEVQGAERGGGEISSGSVGRKSSRACEMMSSPLPELVVFAEAKDGIDGIFDSSCHLLLTSSAQSTSVGSERHSASLGVSSAKHEISEGSS